MAPRVQTRSPPCARCWQASIASDAPAFEPDLIRAWLTARSLSRDLPAPVADRGGWRVDTASADEEVRWVFAQPCAGLSELGGLIEKPRCLIKLCAPASVLMDMSPARWRIEAESWFMTGSVQVPLYLPDGYRLQCEAGDNVVRVSLVTQGGEWAASGYAARTEDAFVYDRIRTEPGHRRRGLGRAVMASLARHCTTAVPQLLTATQEGRALYASIGWRVLAPYVTAGIPPSVTS